MTDRDSADGDVLRRNAVERPEVCDLVRRDPEEQCAESFVTAASSISRAVKTV